MTLNGNNFYKKCNDVESFDSYNYEGVAGVVISLYNESTRAYIRNMDHAALNSFRYRNRINIRIAR